MTSTESGSSHAVAFTAPSAQMMAILDRAEMVRARLVLFGATSGDQHDRHRHLLADELRALGQAFRDPTLDGRLSRFSSALGLMAEVFRSPGPELAGWCNNVLEVPPRRLAHHLSVLAEALFSSNEAERRQPGTAYEPAALEALLGQHLDRARIIRLKSAPLPRRTPHPKSEISPAFLPFRAADFRGGF